MIKASTITKGQVNKDVLLINHKLRRECEQRGYDIKTLIEKLVQVTAEADRLQREMTKIKSHWTYKITNWLK